MTVWYYKPVSLNENTSWLFYVDTLRDKFRPVPITPFLSLPEKLWLILNEAAVCLSQYILVPGWILSKGWLLLVC